MLEALLLLPLIAGILLFFVKNTNASYIALGVSIVMIGISMLMLHDFDPNQSIHGPLQYEIHQPLASFIKSSLHFGVDGISLLFVLLSNIVVLLAVLYGVHKSKKFGNQFFALVLLMQFGLLGLFTSLDGLMFYIFWEITLIPIWLICGIWGQKDKKLRFTTKFFVYTFAGSLLMLGGLIYTYKYAASFALTDLYESALNLNQQVVVFWLIFAAFAVKLPLFPFHTWQPDTYTYSPTPASVLLAGIMLKMAVFGVLRYLLPVTPMAIQGISGDIVILLAVMGVIYGALIAIVEWDIKRIIAYSSFSHVGLMVAGIFASAVLVVRGEMDIDGGLGAVIQSFAHGVNVAGLFICAGILIRIFGTRDIRQMGGFAAQAPKFAVLFFVIVLGSMAVPLTNGFIGEFILLKAVFAYKPLMAALAGLTVILCAVYMLRLFVKTMFGKNTREINATENAITDAEYTALGIITVMVLLFGFFPQPILDLIHAPMELIFKSIKN